MRRPRRGLERCLATLLVAWMVLTALAAPAYAEAGRTWAADPLGRDMILLDQDSRRHAANSRLLCRRRLLSGKSRRANRQAQREADVSRATGFPARLLMVVHAFASLRE